MDDLLNRFKPQLRYDSQEAFFADSAAEMTDNPGNELRAAPHPDGSSGRLISSHATGLALGFLGPAYPDGAAAKNTDRLGIAGSDYRNQYLRLRVARPDLRNRIYGHEREDSSGRLWLQYWLWYFFNDYHLAADFGLHEGDWEMVQIRLHEGEPDLAVYAQHRYAEKRPWSAVKTEPGSPDTPLVFPGRGSHASYFEPGVYETEAWFDIADGKRKTPELELEIVGDDSPPWVAWPGRWGDTEATNPLESRSPDAPSRHAQWLDPAVLLKSAVTRPPRRPRPAPEVTVTRADGSLHVAYNFAHRAGDVPTKLIVTVNSVDEKGVPPRTFTYDIDGLAADEIDTGLELHPEREYDIYTSVTLVTGDGVGLPSASVLTQLEPEGAMPVITGKLLTGVKRFFFTISQAIDGLLRRLHGKRGDT